MKFDFVAFDFDGTLADTLPWFDSIMDSVVQRYGLRKPSNADKARMRHQDAHDILKLLGVPLWKLPAIMAHARGLMREMAPSVQLFDGVPAALAQVKGAGLGMAVVSSNSLENVQRVLGPQACTLFDVFECGTDMFGKSAKIKRLLRRYSVEPARFVLVGDEVRDIDAAREAGVQVSCVAWGYNHVDALRARGPDRIFMNVADLAALLD